MKLTPLSTRLYQALALVIVVLGLLVSAYAFGRHVKSGEVAEENLRALQKLEQKIKEKQDTADALATENALLRAARATQDNLITKEVIRYVDVTPRTDRCTLPGTWRLRHDAAATGTPLAAEAGSVALGTVAAVDDAAALETVAGNYALARRCMAKLDAWQRRYYTLEEPEQ